MFKFNDSQEDQLLDLKLNCRMEERKSKKYTKKEHAHINSAKKLIAQNQLESARIHCAQAIKYKDLSKRSLQKSCDIEIVIELLKSTMESGRTTASITKLIKETAKPFSLTLETDLENDIDELTLRHNLLGVKMGETEALTLDATPLFNQLLHENALNESNKFPDLPNQLNDLENIATSNIKE